MKKPLLPAVWKVPDEFRRRVGSRVGRQRLMESEGHLLLVTHVVPKHNDPTREGRLFWRDAAGSWRSSDAGSGPGSIHKHLDEYAAVIDHFEEVEARAVTAAEYMSLLEGIAPVVRSSRNMLQVMEDARAAERNDRELLDCRDRAYEISRRAELLSVDAKNAMDVALIRRAEQQAESSDRMAVAAHRLNVLAAFFFPLATLAGVFGTAFTDGWNLSSTPIPFTVFLSVGLLAGFILTGFVVRR